MALAVSAGGASGGRRVGGGHYETWLQNLHGQLELVLRLRITTPPSPGGTTVLSVPEDVCVGGACAVDSSSVVYCALKCYTSRPAQPGTRSCDVARTRGTSSQLTCSPVLVLLASSVPEGGEMLHRANTSRLAHKPAAPFEVRTRPFQCLHRKFHQHAAASVDDLPPPSHERGDLRL